VHSTVEGGDQVAVGDTGGAELVVAVLEALLAVEELLFEFGYSLAHSGDFVGSGKADVVEHLFAVHFAEPFSRLSVPMPESLVVRAQGGQLGQQRPSANAGRR
jgi:hypothetical protein